MYLLYDNILLNSKLELNRYLFLNTILELRAVKLSNMSLKLTDALKIL